MTMGPPHAVVPKVGDVVGGRYRVDRVIGQGGMGVVLAVTNRQDRARYAMKCLHAHTADDELALARFEREAKALAQLKNEHVAKVVDVGRLRGGAPYIVMELLVGQDLGERI